MAEMAGRAFLMVVFEKLFEKLASLELRKNSVASKLKMLGEKLKDVEVYLDDAEDKQLYDKKVKEWLDDLKRVVFMADDLVEEITDSNKEKISKREVVMRGIKSVYHSLTKTVQVDIDLILKGLDDLLGRPPVPELNHVTVGDAQSSRSNLEKHDVFGREAEKVKILEMLLSKEDKIVVLPIVGMGGLGKTTLAQLVYDDKLVEEHDFTLKAWVKVSTEFDFCRIIKELLQNVNRGTSTSDIKDPNELQRLMKEAVRGKKFLFVLDDVWNEDYNSWVPLMSSFTTGDYQSRVIVTTRSSVVGSNVKTGSMYELKELHEEDCWSIFVHHAFNGDTNADLELHHIGKRIVAKCKGLPLAVKSIGDFLRSERDPQKWENILRRDVGDWSKVMETRVLPSLWLSYRYLPLSLKRCFAYCSIFPRHHKFKKKRLVWLWMGKGFLPSDEKDKSMEEVGEQWFDDLVLRSLFQRSSEDEDVFIMHDLVRDIAVFVYGIEAKKEKTISSSKAAIIAPLREEHIVFGREAEREEILKWLFSEEDKIGVLPIVGMAGLGKTTLAQLVYGDKRVEHGFTLKAWVTVSTEFDFCRIIKELLQKVNPGRRIASDIKDPNELQRLMKEAVRGKKFLFVLDDVCEENYDHQFRDHSWDPLMSSFTTGDYQSRVIVTTRSRGVGSIVKTGSMHELKELHEVDCWSIFVHHAFNGDPNVDAELHAIGRRIVRKCKGLPSAVKSVAGLLRSERDPQKWENILSSHVWDWSTNQKEVDEKEVDEDDCWSSFVHLAFNVDADADAYPELQAIGRRIVAKWKGLPLGVKSVASLLRYERNPQKWEDWSEALENGVLSSLWLSYRYLPSSLKQCFGYCSLFPQGYEFDKKQMVLLWMAEGFLPSDEKDKSVEEIGEQYFDDLVSRSLFQRSSGGEDDRVSEIRFVMNGLVHDLAGSCTVNSVTENVIYNTL